MHLKLKNMKGIDISCASPSSTAICTSIDQHSMVRNGTKSIQRLNSYIGDQYKTFTNNINIHSPSRAPCISELPFTPRPSSFSYHEKTRKLAAAVKHSDVITRRRSSADVSDVRRYNNIKNSYDDGGNSYKYSPPSGHSSRYLLSESKFLDSLYESESHTRTTTKPYSQIHRSGSVKNNYTTKKPETTSKTTFASEPSTPVFGSQGRRSTSRVETRRFGSMLDEEKEKIRKHFSLIDVKDNERGINSRNKVSSKKGEETTFDNGHSQRHNSMGRYRNDSLVQKSSSCAKSRDQVVVLRVSLHCKGCESKLRKHLSKMEGVTSFSIDLETKKVTVIGKVTPLDVLTSISKVKNAQFWPTPASNSSSNSSSSSPSSSSSTSTSSIAEYN